MIYLDNAATTLVKPEKVIRRVTESLGHCANPGRSGHKLSVQTAMAVYEAREAVAAFFGIEDAMRVVFGQNCTDALNLALHGGLSAGDHVVTTSMEHNSILRPLNALALHGVQHTIVETGPAATLDVATVAAAIQPNTKMLAVNHASNLTGILNPLRELGTLCRQRDILFLVDAAQSAGCLPINVQDLQIDLLAAPGHKGLFGLQGTGFLYIGPRAQLREVRQGGTGSHSSDPFQPDILPDRYESGTVNMPGILSLGAGIEYLNAVGLAAVEAHDRALAKQMLEGLAAIPGVTVYGDATPDKRLPVVAFNIRGLPSAETATLLDTDYDIATRSGFHCAPLAHRSLGTAAEGSVRISASWFTTRKEVDTALRAIAALAQSA